ncbi:DMSO/selenate family reductase complex A subunit [Devriesea agamarum]|uniref:DMSO/selenate family reductase complex A subunit n=1 Tax=Devriesea agamarum TaxID=472569 RepID=UPI000B14986B|nr:DMSO/selenate family reductase complex A subunit [Devriesea agamarum]
MPERSPLPDLRTNAPDEVAHTATKASRRSFLFWSGIAGGSAAGALGLSSCGLLPRHGQDQPVAKADFGKLIWSSCNVNCGSRCPLLMRVDNGQIVRIEPDPTGNNELGTQQVRACVRGRSIRQRIYNPDRLKYPMKRVGKRGEGKFRRITWDEAYDHIARELRRIIKQYGNESVFINYGTGVLGGTVTASWPPGKSIIARFMNLIGGSLDQYGDYSTGCITEGMNYQYGQWMDSNSNDDTANAKLVVMFGNNPHETRMSGGGEVFVTQEVKRRSGHRVIVIDPRYSETAMNLADEWIPIRPGTDAALVAALAHVLISENLIDQKFLDTYTVGFDEQHLPAGAPAGSSYRSYVMGQGRDKIAKTPQWAAPITGISAQRIEQLAREIAQAKPCSINQGWGPQRQAAGENTSRAIMTLAAMIGQIGISGGGTGCREGSANLGMVPMPVGENPVKATLPFFMWTEAIRRGHEMTALTDGIKGADKISSDLKFIWNYGSNALINQHADVNRTHKLLQDESKAEMIVVIDNQMTASARYADILLPDVSNAEQSDLVKQGSAGNMGYTILASQAITPLFDCRTIYEMMTSLAERFGVKDNFTEGRTQEEWLQHLVELSRETIPDLPDYDTLKKQGIFRKKLDSVIPLKNFREDPVANPLPTPSGKIEIYSSVVQEMAQTWILPPGDELTPIPEFIRTWEMPGDPLQEKYPLQMIGHHFKGRTHSSYGNVAWLKEMHPQSMWINPLDAKEREIKPGDTVEVFNDRGRIRIEAFVTPRIAPGVVSVPQGAWFTPDKDGVDIGGCTNTLTSQRPTAASKSNAQHTNLVQVDKA